MTTGCWGGSEWDVLLKVVAQGLDNATVAVSDVTTPDPECLQHDDEIVYAMNKMAVGGYRHVPVLKDDGAPERYRLHAGHR